MKKLAEIQKELKAPKGQYNSFGKYKYRSCEDILEAVKPLLAKNACTLTLSDNVCEVNGRFYIVATATLTDLESGEMVQTTALAREEETKKGMDASQITGTASSYARKYCLNGLFLIDDTKDADTDEFKKNTERKEEPKAETYREKIKKYVFENQLDMNEFAAHHKLTKSTTEAEYKALWEKIEKGEQ